MALEVKKRRKMKRGISATILALTLPVMASAGAFAEGMMLSITASQGSDGVITFEGTVEDGIERVKCNLNNTGGTTEQSEVFVVSEGKFGGSFTAEMKGYNLSCANVTGGDPIVAEILQPDMESINEAKEAAAKAEADEASSVETTGEAAEASENGENASTENSQPNMLPVIIGCSVAAVVVVAVVIFLIIRKKKTSRKVSF